MIPFPPWEPDKGPFSETSTDHVVNVTPISNGWAGFPDLSAISSAITGTACGGCYYRTSDGSYGIVVGTTTNLYKLNTGTVPYSWTNVSGPSAPYAVPTGQMWQFARFGTGLYAVSLGAPMQYLNVDLGGNFADAAGSPPRAKYITIVGDFIILGYLKVGATEFPNKWASSGLNAPTIWTVGTQLADEQVLADGDEVVGLIGQSQGGRVLQRHAKRSLVLTPDAAMPIKSQVIDASFGIIAPLSIVTISGDDYVYLAEDGFQRGDDKTPIGSERVNRWFLSDCNISEIENVLGVADPLNHMVWWRYKSIDGSYRMIGWDWEIDRWAYSDANVLVLLSAVTAGVTLEGLDAIFLSLYGSSSIDTANAESFDSRRWAGGRPTFAAIGPDGIMYLFTGNNRAATLDTTAQVVSGSMFQRVGITGAYAVTDTSTYTLAKAGANRHGDVALASFGTGIAPAPRTGIVPLRGDHLLARFRLSVPANTEWSYVHGVEPQTVRAGQG
jgi:hypothetical protein